IVFVFYFFFSSRRRHTRSKRDWSSDVCSSDLDDWGVANRYGVEFRGEVHPTGDRVVTVGADGSFSDVRTNIFTGDANPTSNVVQIGRASCRERVEVAVVDG